MAEIPAPTEPWTYQKQYNYYRALCESASQIADSWSNYRRLIAQIRKELRADPDFKELVANKFRAPENTAVEHKPEEPDSDNLEALLGLGYDF